MFLPMPRAGRDSSLSGVGCRCGFFGDQNRQQGRRCVGAETTQGFAAANAGRFGVLLGRTAVQFRLPWLTTPLTVLF
jgi:hypothetical protein